MRFGAEYVEAALSAQERKLMVTKPSFCSAKGSSSSKRERMSAFCYGSSRSTSASPGLDDVHAASRTELTSSDAAM
jgi:hypothetical protein